MEVYGLVHIKNASKQNSLGHKKTLKKQALYRSDSATSLTTVRMPPIRDPKPLKSARPVLTRTSSASGGINSPLDSRLVRLDSRSLACECSPPAELKLLWLECPASKAVGPSPFEREEEHVDRDETEARSPRVDVPTAPFGDGESSPFKLENPFR